MPFLSTCFTAILSAIVWLLMKVDTYNIAQENLYIARFISFTLNFFGCDLGVVEALEKGDT